MLKIGLTGNIGSGKSTVATIFSRLGVPVYHADHVAKGFLEKPEVRHQILSTFGEGVFDPTGAVDRKALAAVVFQDEGLLARLNGILHPLVRDDFRAWVASMTQVPYVVQEAAILFESGFAGEFHRTIHVSCPEAICVERVMQRDGIPNEAVRQRIQHQWSDNKKSTLADFIILNDGSRLLIPQVLELHERFLALNTNNASNPQIAMNEAGKLANNQ